MLYMGPDASKLERLQGTWLTEDEISRVIRYWKGVRSFEDRGPARQSSIGYPDRYDEDFDDDFSERRSDRSTARSDAVPTNPSAIEPQDLAQAPLFDQIDAMKSVDARDELYDDAVGAVADAGRGSVTLLQRKLRIGYGRASRLVEQLEEAGVLSPDLGGNKGRKYLGDGDYSAEPDQDAPADGDSRTCPAQTAQQRRPASPHHRRRQTDGRWMVPRPFTAILDRAIHPSQINELRRH